MGNIALLLNHVSTKVHPKIIASICSGFLDHHAKVGVTKNGFIPKHVRLTGKKLRFQQYNVLFPSVVQLG